MTRFVQDFPSHLPGIDLMTLETDPHSIFALSEQLKLTYFNPAWLRFARTNNGEPDISTHYPIGSDFTRAVSGEMKQFYIDRFKYVLRSGVVWEHDYECSSPELFRIYHETAYPMREKSGVLVVNSLLVETAHAPADGPSPLLESRYRTEAGMIMQCGYCRRFQRNDAPDVWDWNPEWIRNPPEQVHHSLCRLCFDYYFGNHRADKPRL